MLDELITFQAYFPPIQSALKVTGTGDGARIQLDIPETDMAAVAHLLLMRGQTLEVTMQVVQSVTNGKTETRQRTARNPLGVAGG
jgi:hypothetical protein